MLGSFLFLQVSQFYDILFNQLINISLINNEIFNPLCTFNTNNEKLLHQLDNNNNNLIINWLLENNSKKQLIF